MAAVLVESEPRLTWRRRANALTPDGGNGPRAWRFSGVLAAQAAPFAATHVSVPGAQYSLPWISL